jgi:hypothetical protein
LRGLDLILAKHSHLRVLRVLHHAHEPLSGREVERRSGLSNRAAMMALETLTEASAVSCEVTPRANCYSLSSDNYLVNRAIRPGFEAEELFWEDLKKTVRRIVRPRPSCAVVTGPIARDDALFSGHLELVMVFSSGRQRVRAFPSSEKLIETILDRYGLSADFTLIDANAADRSEYDTLWRRVEREGVLLYGVLP